MFRIPLFYVFIFILTQFNFTIEAAEIGALSFEFKKGINLNIPIPSGFIVGCMGPNSNETVLGEFIKEGETVESWTEMMTLLMAKYPSDPSELATRISASYKKVDPAIPFEMIKATESNIKLVYTYADTICHFTMPGTTMHEYNGGKIISNATKTWIIQYAIRYEPAITTEEQKAKMREKIELILKSCKFDPI